MDKMKLFFASLFFLFFVLSCQKADNNGDLGGFWKLMEVESVANGSKNDLRQRSYFMSIQLELMQLRGGDSHFARFQHSGDSLFVQMIGGNAEETLLQSFGMNGQEQRFCVKKLNRKSLILQSDFSILRFKKF